MQGIHLVGGGGLLRGLDSASAEETEVPVQLVDAPLEAVVLGAGTLHRVLRVGAGHVHGRPEPVSSPRFTSSAAGMPRPKTGNGRPARGRSADDLPPCLPMS